MLIRHMSLNGEGVETLHENNKYTTTGAEDEIILFSQLNGYQASMKETNISIVDKLEETNN